MMKDETVGWPHRLNGLEFEQALGVGDEQGSLACCSPRGHKKLDTTERLNNNNDNKGCRRSECPLQLQASLGNDKLVFVTWRDLRVT